MQRISHISSRKKGNKTRAVADHLQDIYQQSLYRSRTYKHRLYRWESHRQCCQIQLFATKLCEICLTLVEAKHVSNRSSSPLSVCPGQFLLQSCCLVLFHDLESLVTGCLLEIVTEMVFAPDAIPKVALLFIQTFPGLGFQWVVWCPVVQCFKQHKTAPFSMLPHQRNTTPPSTDVLFYLCFTKKHRKHQAKLLCFFNITRPVLFLHYAQLPLQLSSVFHSVASCWNV